ncbi:arsenate reductase/protein-tyrosine-phosphatase family protein [Geodermatophilus sp. SYSU D00710]
MHILFVCTGNVCRSPLAERLARARARELLAESPEVADVHISSAGLVASHHLTMDPHTVAALLERGGDPEDFRPRVLTRELAETSDLIITMTRRQRRSVLEMAPRGLRRTFTLSETTDLLGSADLGGLPFVAIAERPRELSFRLDTARAMRTSSDGDDIADPFGRRASVHREIADSIATALRPLTEVLFTSVRMQLPVPVPV